MTTRPLLLLLLLLPLPGWCQSGDLYKPYVLRLPWRVVLDPHPAPAPSPVVDAGWDHICPQCKLLGIKSRVKSGMCSCTAVYCGGTPMWDENGQPDYYPSSNCNTCTCDYSCSNGHFFTTKELSP